MFKTNLSLIFLLLLSITLKAQYAEQYKISPSLRQFETGKERNTLSVEEAELKEYSLSGRADIGLSRRFEDLYLGYSLYLYRDKSEGSLTFLYATPSAKKYIPKFLGFIAGTQVLFSHETIVTAKLGYRLVLNLVALQVDAGINTNFKNVSYTVSPSIGFSLLEIITPYYAFNYQFGRHSFSSLDNPHRLGVLIIVPPINADFGNKKSKRRY